MLMVDAELDDGGNDNVMNSKNYTKNSGVDDVDADADEGGG